MDWPPCGRPPQNQTTRVRDIVGVLFNSLTCIQNPQDLVNPDNPGRNPGRFQVRQVTSNLHTAGLTPFDETHLLPRQTLILIRESALVPSKAPL
jgi:hypothetical protein